LVAHSYLASWAVNWIDGPGYVVSRLDGVNSDWRSSSPDTEW
jgi:hypothetical protein